MHMLCKLYHAVLSNIASYYWSSLWDMKKTFSLVSEADIPYSTNVYKTVGSLGL
jgi:hypothetical protein